MKGSLPYLQILAKSKPKLRKILIDNVPESVITAIYEYCWNTLKGVVPLTQRQKRRLAPYKTHLRALANRKVSRKRKKIYLTQRGAQPAKRRRNNVRACRRIDVEKWLKTQMESTLRYRRCFDV